MTESAVPAARTANASSAPPPYSGASRVHGRWMIAVTTSAALASMAAMRTFVVRSRPQPAGRRERGGRDRQRDAGRRAPAMRGSGTVTVRHAAGG